MEQNTVESTISNITSKLAQMNGTIRLYDDLKHDSFNRLLARIEQAIEDEQSAWKETAASLAEPEASEGQTNKDEIGERVEWLVGR